jgi:two-component sensor histidine kinase/Tfp pilus assembly protein PilF
LKIFLKYNFIFTGLFCLLNLISVAQPSKIDSLLRLLKKDKPNALKVKHLNELSEFYIKINPDTSLIFALQATMLSKELEIQKEVSRSYANMGSCFIKKGEYEKALGYFDQALMIDEDLGDKTAQANHLGSIGLVYKEQADYVTALEFFYKALKICEQIGDLAGKAQNLNNLGNVYSNLGENKKALNFYTRALNIDASIKNKAGMAKRYGNIGNIYYSELNYDLALLYFNRALRLATQMDDKAGIAADLGNIGNIYYDKQEYEKALEFYLKALDQNQAIGNRNGIAINCGNIGGLYTKKPTIASPEGETEKGYALAAKYLYRAIAIDDSLGSKYGMQYRYEALANLYQLSTEPLPDSAGGKLLNHEQMRLKALYYYKIFENYKDDIFSETKKRDLIRKELSLEFAKKNALSQAEKRSQRITLILVSSVGLIILIFAVFIFFSLQKTRKQKGLIEKSNHEKELLLKEIHHRVKNNLQVISSLLNLQSGNINDDKTLLIFKQAQVRVRSMGLIHQKLYQEGNFSDIDFGEYLEQLTSYISQMYHDGLGEISCNINISQQRFNIDTATPLGLIITELLSNSYKYAFNKGENGKINIAISRVEKQNYLLEYSDSGKGLPEDINVNKSSTLGLELVRLLTEQLHGSIKTFNKNGAVFKIYFKAETGK